MAAHKHLFLLLAVAVFNFVISTIVRASDPGAPITVAHPMPGSTGTFVRPIEFASPSLSGRPSVTDTSRIKNRAGVFANLMVSPSRQIYRYINDDRFSAAATDADRLKLFQPIVIDQRFSTVRKIESVLDLRGRPLVLRVPSGTNVNLGGVELVGLRFAPLAINITVNNAAVKVLRGTMSESSEPVKTDPDVPAAAASKPQQSEEAISKEPGTQPLKLEVVPVVAKPPPTTVEKATKAAPTAAPESGRVDAPPAKNTAAK